MLYNEEFRSLHSLSNTARMIKFRKLRCSGHFARMGGGKFGLLTKTKEIKKVNVCVKVGDFCISGV